MATGARQKRKRARPDKLTTAEKKRAFLAAYAQCGNVSHAARLAGISRETHYEWLTKDSNYAAAFQQADAQAADALELEARRRALEGWEEPVYQKAQLVGTVRRYSDTLLIFLLKGARPEKYRERHEISGDPQRPLALDIRDEHVEQAVRLLEALAAEARDGDTAGSSDSTESGR